MFRFPIVRLTIIFVLGIAAQQAFCFALHNLWLSVLGSALCFFICHVVAKKFPKCVAGSTFSAALLFCALGAATLETRNEANAPKHYANQLAKNRGAHVFLLEVREKLKFSQKSARYICLVEKIDHAASDGKIVFTQTIANPERLIIGERIKAYGVLAFTKPPMNPGQFDYGAYLKNKGIFAQLHSTRIKRVGLKRDVWHFAESVRTRILNNVAKSNFGNAELPVFAALMLGQQQEIDAETIRNYQYSGAVHILSVSGLHVGFLMLVLQALLRFVPNSGKWPLAKLAVLLFALWGFAFIAGLAASVVRSVVMFSFVAVGKQLSRNTNVFNTLFASMLLILIAKPAFLFDVGFELSYLAVFFIVWLKPIFDRRWTPENRVLNYLADILKVSFAAQIGTLPLSLYYFHQFPMLFFVTNAIVIPALGIIMALGLLTLVWACCAPVPPWLGWLSCKSIWALNATIAKVASYESFVVKDIGFSIPLLLTGYLLIVALGNLMQKQSFLRVSCFLLAVASVQTCYLWFGIRSKRVSELVVFQSWKHTLVTYKTQNRIVALTNDTTQNTTKLLVEPYATRLNCRWLLKSLQNTISFDKKRILIVDRSGIYPNISKPDLIVLCGSPKMNLDRLIKTMRPKFVVADGSNFKPCVTLWKRTCSEQKIPFHATAEKGSFIMKGAP